jgi:hypothetical protein
MTTKQQIQKILEGILHKKDENKQNHEKTGSTKPWEKKRQDSETSIDSIAHNQIFKQDQLNSRNHHTPIDINTECQWTQLPHQKTVW